MIHYKTHASATGIVITISLLALALFLTSGSLSSLVVQSQSTSPGNYVYSVKPSGVADVTVVIKGVAGSYDVYVRVDQGIINESITAFDSQGNMLPAQLINKTLVDVITANTTDEVIIEYVAIIGKEMDGVTSVSISPYGNATVKLPSGSALLYFTGNPVIHIISSSITLYYPNPGKYNVSFVIQAVTSPTSVTSSSTTTTTQKTTQTPTTTTSTTTTTTTQTTTPTTTYRTTTSTPPPSSSTEITSPTSISTTKTTSTPTTSTLPASKTTTNTSASTTKSTSITQQAPSVWGNPLLWLALIAVITIIIALFALSKSRRGGTQTHAGSSPPPESPGTIESAGLDDRDIALLDLISKKETTISELAKRSGLSKSVVWRRTRKLSDLGLISKEDLGIKTILRITEAGLKALKDYRSVH